MPRLDKFMTRTAAIDMINLSGRVVLDHEGEFEVLTGEEASALPDRLGRRFIGSEQRALRQRMSSRTVYIAELWSFQNRAGVLLVEGPPAARVLNEAEEQRIDAFLNKQPFR
jgi:hypothetical protein